MKRPRKRSQRKATRQVSQAGKRKFISLKTLEDFFALTQREQELWGDIGQIVTEVRDGVTLAQASRLFRRDPRTVQQLAGTALRKRRNGRWAAKKYDRLLRVLPLPTSKGSVEVAVRDSRQSSIIGRYWNAVDRYRDTGEASALREFRGKQIIDADGKRVRLLTDLHELDRLGSAGNLSFESFYARVA
jgi:hypothetical protein